MYIAIPAWNLSPWKIKEFCGDCSGLDTVSFIMHLKCLYFIHTGAIKKEKRRQKASDLY